MSSAKKAVRQAFRDAVFERDGHKCKLCDEPGIEGDANLDAHHITDRNLMPNGGYVKENGISLCSECHDKAEVFHRTGEAHSGYSPEDLYVWIKSNHEEALKASKKLK